MVNSTKKLIKMTFLVKQIVGNKVDLQMLSLDKKLIEIIQST